MKTMEASLEDMVKSYTRGAVPYIVLVFPEKGGPEGDILLVAFVKSIVRGKMMSSRSMRKVGIVAENVVLSRDVVGRIAKENSQ